MIFYHILWKLLQLKQVRNRAGRYPVLLRAALAA